MSSSTDTPDFCADCGATLAATARFCPQCGRRLGGGAAVPGRDARNARDRGAAAGDDRAWLDRRVADLRLDGWEPLADRGDRVVLRRRSMGALPIHVLLFLLTGGFGNVVYAAYRYTTGAPRMEVHADGTERRVPRERSVDLPTVVAVAVVGLLGLGAAAWVGLALLVDLSALALVVGAAAFVLLALATALAPRVARDGRRSVTTFGRERSVERERVHTPPEPCAACGRRVLRGERRRYGERLYVAGLPLGTSAAGENTYCADCAPEADATGADGEGLDDLDAELARLRREARREDSGNEGTGTDAGEPTRRGRSPETERN